MATKSDKRIHLDTTNPATRRKLYKAIRALTPGVYAIDLTRRRWRVADAQRAFYWGYIIAEVSPLMGRDRDQTDKALNALFLSEQWAIAGQVVTVVRSLADLDPVAASKYFEDITAWVLANYRVRLGSPDPTKRKEKG